MGMKFLPSGLKLQNRKLKQGLMALEPFSSALATLLVS
jgi:hypothetical protein